MSKRQDVAIGRCLGPSPKAQETMKEAAEAAIWRGSCPDCHTALKGTLKQLREHKCDGEQGNSRTVVA